MNLSDRIRSHLYGVIEIFLLRPEGVSRFSPGYRATLASFIVLIGMLPFHYLFEQILIRAAGRGDPSTVMQFFAASLVEVAGVICAVFLIFFIEGKRALFFQAVTIGNWMSLSGLLPFILILAVAAAGWTEAGLLVTAVFFFGFSFYTLLFSTLVIKTMLESTWMRAVAYIFATVALLSLLQRGVMILLGL